jgi:hypothetical protein
VFGLGLTHEKYTHAPTVKNEENISIDSSPIVTHLEVDLVDVVDMDIVSNIKKISIGTFKKPLTASTSDPSSPILYTPVSLKIPEPSIFHPTNIKDNQQIKKPNIRSCSISSARKDTNIEEILDPVRDTLSKKRCKIH